MGQCVWRGGAECDSKTPLQEDWGRRRVDWQMAPDTSTSLKKPDHEGIGPSLTHPVQGNQHKAKSEKRERELPYRRYTEHTHSGDMKKKRNVIGREGEKREMRTEGGEQEIRKERRGEWEKRKERRGRTGERRGEWEKRKFTGTGMDADGGEMSTDNSCATINTSIFFLSFFFHPLYLNKTKHKSRTVHTCFCLFSYISVSRNFRTAELLEGWCVGVGGEKGTLVGGGRDWERLDGQRACALLLHLIHKKGRTEGGERQGDRERG